VKKDGRYIFELVDKCIEEIGVQNVVQVVTDNAKLNEAATSLLKAKHPSIFWNGCAAHTIDLMLEDIGNMPIVAQAREDLDSQWRPSSPYPITAWYWVRCRV
jgi:hypothetical protein